MGPTPLMKMVLLYVALMSSIDEQNPVCGRAAFPASGSRRTRLL
jgi:hypothetical protein